MRRSIAVHTPLGQLCPPSESLYHRCFMGVGDSNTNPLALPSLYTESPGQLHLFPIKLEFSALSRQSSRSSSTTTTAATNRVGLGTNRHACGSSSALRLCVEAECLLGAKCPSVAPPPPPDSHFSIVSDVWCFLDVSGFLCVRVRWMRSALVRGVRSC